MKFSRLNYSTKYLIFSISILLVINIAAGILLINQSSSFLIDIIQERMLDISNVASSMIDGDKLQYLNKEDVDTPEYKKIYQTLKYFKDNIKLKYIYCIKENGDKKFTFSVDPAEDPGEFGSPVVYTDALYAASLGKASVDKEPYEDKWGKFYSSYSPVFNSSGGVAGIVAVDFSADWYDQQISDLILKNILVVVVSLIICAIIVKTFSGISKRRFKNLFNQLNVLADNVEELVHNIDKVSENSFINNKYERSFFLLNNNPNDSDIDTLKKTITAMQIKLSNKISIMHKMAYIDGMTSLKNKSAYLQTVKELDKKSPSTPSYIVAVFDICSLKTVNDNFGHEYGDMLIIDAANLLKEIFGSDNIYRFGGDEFIGIFYNLNEKDINTLLNSLETKIDYINKSNKYNITLKISKDLSFSLSKTE